MSPSRVDAEVPLIPGKKDYNSTKNGLDATTTTTYTDSALSQCDILNAAGEAKRHEVPMGTKRKLRVIFMGMGCSGINFAHRLKQKMTDVDLVIYEKNNDVGGTWLENRYPGCACDIPSVCYQYSWAKSPDWDRYYSGSKQIHSYFRKIAEDYDVLKYAYLNHQILRAEWLQDIGKWKVTVMRNNNPQDIIEDYGDFFLHGGGVLNNWRWPNVKGLHSFQGPMLHTARWDENVDYKSKKVLIIGAGSSGVQVVPTIIDQVDRLYVVARSPIWITAGFAPEYAGPNGENFDYSDETKEKFRNDPVFYLKYCKAIESELNVRFKFYINGSQDAQIAREYSIKEMQRKLVKKPELMDHLIPSKFGVGCRRPTPGNGFLEALTLDKTTVLTKEIQEVNATGFIDDKGNEHAVDVVICATGFDTSFSPAFPVLVDGKNIQEEYRAGHVVGYFGLTAPSVPNYFIFIGAYGPLGHGSVVPMVEAYTDYFIQVLEKAQVEDIKSIRVNRQVAEAFTRHADSYLKGTAWSGPCSSWFKNGVVANKPLCWPGSRVHYLTMLQTPRWEDYDYEYLSSDRFNFLGNGFDVREFDGRDITWYYGLIDGEDKQPKEFPSPVW